MILLLCSATPFCKVTWEQRKIYSLAKASLILSTHKNASRLERTSATLLRAERFLAASQGESGSPIGVIPSCKEAYAASLIHRCRYFRVPAIRETLGCANPQRDPEAHLYTSDECYLPIDIVLNMVGDSIALCFFHAVINKTSNDNNEANKSHWTNWCGTPRELYDVEVSSPERPSWSTDTNLCKPPSLFTSNVIAFGPLSLRRICGLYRAAMSSCPLQHTSSNSCLCPRTTRSQKSFSAGRRRVFTQTSTESILFEIATRHTTMAATLQMSLPVLPKVYELHHPPRRRVDTPHATASLERSKTEPTRRVHAVSEQNIRSLLKAWCARSSQCWSPTAQSCWHASIRPTSRR